MRTIVAGLLLSLGATASLADYPPTVVVHFGDVAVTDCGESWTVPTPDGTTAFWLAETEADDCGEAGLCTFTVEREWLRLDGARLVIDFAQASMFTIWAELVLRDDAAIGGTRVLVFDSEAYESGQPPYEELANATVGDWETIATPFPRWGMLIVAGCATRITEVRIHTEPSATAESTFGAIKALYGGPDVTQQ